MAFSTRSRIAPALRTARAAGRRRVSVAAVHADQYAPRLMLKEEELLTASDGGLAEGQLRRQVRLGSKALYRVCACEGNYARVEVVQAPGLRPGAHYKFTRAAVELMELVDESLDSSDASSPRTVPSRRTGERQRF
jgi:hypothetical protein